MSLAGILTVYELSLKIRWPCVDVRPCEVAISARSSLWHTKADNINREYAFHHASGLVMSKSHCLKVKQ